MSCTQPPSERTTSFLQRILKRITIEDLAETERTINLLMSDAVASRRDLIEDEAEFYYDDEMTQVSL